MVGSDLGRDAKSCPFLRRVGAHCGNGDDHNHDDNDRVPPSCRLKSLSGKQLEIHSSLRSASGLICQHSNPIDLSSFQPSVLTVQRAGSQRNYCHIVQSATVSHIYDYN